VSFLSDATLRHLRAVADEPDLSATRYRILSRLERGGMGTVYVAEDLELRRQVALKVLSVPDPDGGLARRMLDEARILARLEHAGIVPIHDVGQLPDGRVFYVMKLVRGQRLDRHAADLAQVSDALRIALRIAEAVAFAHAHGVIHRDLKPQNIMVGEFGEVMVMDFGIAKLHSVSVSVSVSVPVPEPEPAPEPAPEAVAVAVTRPGTRLGTPGWMAPEQSAGATDRIDHRADVYGLGALLAFLLARGGWVERRADDAATPGALLDSVRPRVARPLRAIAARALAAEPERRYASADAFADDLARFLDGRAVSAYREGPLERAGRVVSNYRTAVALVLTYMILRVLLLLFSR
jgi:serine/threonine protein kinase